MTRRCTSSVPGSTRQRTQSWSTKHEIAAWAVDNPQPYQRDAYLGLYQDIHGTPDEPENSYIQQLARDGLSKVGHHGKVSAMGVSKVKLPTWDDHPDRHRTVGAPSAARR